MRTKLLALFVGTLCHLSFCLAVGIMVMALFGYMHFNTVSLPYRWAWVYDLLLLVQFPILHTLLLRSQGRAFLSRLFPGEIGKHLITTTFVIAASVQLLLLFSLWAHLGSFEWRPSGSLLTGWTLIYLFSWTFLAIAMANAGLATQMGFLGWTAVYRGTAPNYPSFPRNGLYKVCRHPVYFAMALVSSTGPVWNIDHLIIASVFIAYCIAGPRMKERRLLASFGPSFAAHMREVPFFPTPRSCWRAFTKSTPLGD